MQNLNGKNGGYQMMYKSYARIACDADSMQSWSLKLTAMPLQLLGSIINSVMLGMLFGLMMPVHAASFDCGGTKTQVEKIICEDEYLSRLDDALNREYINRLRKQTGLLKLKSEQRKWLKEVRNTCSDITCLRTSYEARIRQIKNPDEYEHELATVKDRSDKVGADGNPAMGVAPYESHVRRSDYADSEITSIQRDWNTDGYWYFFSKDKENLPVLAHIDHDGSDALLSLSRDDGLWVNKKRPATVEELAKKDIFGHYSLFVSYPPQVLCGKFTVEVETSATAKFAHPLDSRVVIRDFSGIPLDPKSGIKGFERGKELKSFAIFRKQTPPKVVEGVLSEDYQNIDKPLAIPIASSIYAVAPLPDCTFLAKMEDGVVRFTATGETQAILPPDARLIYGEEIQRLNNTFNMSSHPADRDTSLQPRLWFFYHNIFKGDRK